MADHDALEGGLWDVGGVYLRHAEQATGANITSRRPGHYNRALEEALTTHQSQWPRSWAEWDPLTANRTFDQMTADERVGGFGRRTESGLSGQVLMIGFPDLGSQGARGVGALVIRGDQDDDQQELSRESARR